MISSTKWIVAIFAVVATFAVGMFLVQSGFASSIGAGEPKIMDAQDNPPHFFLGKVFDVSGETVSAGTVVTAFINGERQGSTTVRAGGDYTLPVSQGAGTWITFKIGAVAATEVATWQVGDATILNLNTSSGKNLLLNPGGGHVGIGTFKPIAQLDITGNFRLPASTATTGIILSGGSPFIHNFGDTNFFAGVDAGNLTMTGILNTAIGEVALTSNTSGQQNTAVGAAALFTSTANHNTGLGSRALINNTSGANNTATGSNTLVENTTGRRNTATGTFALNINTTGEDNTALGENALFSNTTGNQNTAIGKSAGVSQGNLTNATAIGANAIVDASNKIRLGDSNIEVIEAQVDITVVSDVNQKENFQAVDGEETLEKLRELTLESWNFKGHDPNKFRHYGPTAQDFFAAFGRDGIGSIGSETTINSGDMAGIMMIAIQELAKQNAALRERIDDFEAGLAATGE